MLIQHNGKSMNNGTVERCQVLVDKYKLVTRPKDPQAVLDRAHSREGKNGYNLVFSNCEHFCLWCITGKQVSTQMMRHSARVAATALRATPLPCVALVATELSWEAVQSIRAYCKGQITAKACVRNITTATASVAGGVAGAAAGIVAGRAVAGKLGAAVGGVVGGAIGQHMSNRLCDSLTKTLVVDSREDALMEAYRVLGVVPASTNQEINSAYRRQALTCHPDRGGKKEDFLRLSTAMEMIRMARRECPDSTEMKDEAM